MWGYFVFLNAIYFFVFHVIPLWFVDFSISAQISKASADSSAVFFLISIFHTGGDIKDSYNLPHRLPVLIFTHKTQTHSTGTDKTACFMTNGRIPPDSEREHGQYGKSTRGLIYLYLPHQGHRDLLGKSCVLIYGLFTWEKSRGQLVLETHLIAKRRCP